MQALCRVVIREIVMNPFVLFFIFLCLLAGGGARAAEPQQTGFLGKNEVSELADNIWRNQYRIADLTSQIQVGKASRSDAVLGLQEDPSGIFEILERSRAELEKNPENLFFAFETWEHIADVLSHLEGLRAYSKRRGDTSLAGQLSQGLSELRELQKNLYAYVRYLIGNHHQVFSAVEGNLAECHKRLGWALGNQTGRARIMPNRPPERPRLPRKRPPETVPSRLSPPDAVETSSP